MQFCDKEFIIFYLVSSQLIPKDQVISDSCNKKKLNAKEEARKLNVVLLTVSQLILLFLFFNGFYCCPL